VDEEAEKRKDLLEGRYITMLNNNTETKHEKEIWYKLVVENCTCMRLVVHACAGPALSSFYLL